MAANVPRPTLITETKVIPRRWFDDVFREVFARGYGKANVEKREPILAGKALFRIASITKLFSTTAVMQLVEEVKLDLHRDVNTYLTEF